MTCPQVFTPPLLGLRACPGAVCITQLVLKDSALHQWQNTPGPAQPSLLEPSWTLWPCTHGVRVELDGCGVLAAADAAIAFHFAAEPLAAPVQLRVGPVALGIWRHQGGKPDLSPSQTHLGCSRLGNHTHGSPWAQPASQSLVVNEQHFGCQIQPQEPFRAQPHLWPL